MNIRNRLTLGIGVLFILILLLGLQSVRSVRQLSVASKDILADNYNSVHYVEEMLRSLDCFSQDSASRGILISSLELHVGARFRCTKRHSRDSGVRHGNAAS